MAQRVKTYDYIKRSDISVLKATIDGKVMNVDPKTILSGTYVAGKIKPTAAKLRVAKVDPSKIREKMLKMYKDWAEDEYKSEFEKYITTEDIQKFVECGLTEEMIIAFYCGIQAVMDIKADNEFGYYKVGGVFTFRTDEDGMYIKSWVERGLYNCENGVYELGFKYPDFNWSSLLKRGSGTEVIYTPPYDYFGKERIDASKLEKFTVNSKFTVIAVKSGSYSENGVFSSSSTNAEMRDPNIPLELNGGYLSVVSRNANELFALAKKLLSQPKSYVKDFDWLVQSKTNGAEELNTSNYKFKNGGNINAEIDGLQKGDTITIEYGSSINKDNKVTLKVRSRNKVRKGTIDKITFDNTNNPSGVKFYAYNRGKGWSFAIGDMGISNVKIVSTYAEGGSIETITRLNGNRQEYTLPLPKISILTSEINDTALTWIEDNTGLKFRKTAWAYEAQPQKSEQIVKLLTMYGFVTQFHNNATNKNVLFLKFFKDEFMQYAKGGNLAQKGLHKATSTGDSIADWAFNFDPKKRYANGGGIEDVDFMAAARTSARDSIDWSEELRTFAGENYDSLSELEKESIIADLQRDWDFQHSFAKGGNVRTMEKHDAVIYRDETWYVTEKGGQVGIVSMRQGAWGSDYPFVPLTKIIQEDELTDMYGNKVFIPYSFAKGGVTEHGLAKGDKITADLFWENRAVVTDKDGEKVIVDLEKGKRGVKYATGGNVPRFYLSDEILNSMSSSEYDDLYLKARRWQMQEVGGGEMFSLPEAMYLIYYDQNFPKGSKERKKSWELYKKYALDKKAKGGTLDETKYIPRDEIIKVELKNGKVIMNTYNNPIYSGVRVGEGSSEAEEMEKKGQLSMFAKGGNLPQYAKYIPKSQVAKIYVYDEDEPTVIKGSEIVGGVWYDNEKAEKLIALARKQGLIK